LRLSCKILEKVIFGPPICRGRGYPGFWICILKLHLLPRMWPIVVEFRSASLEIRRREKKTEKRKKKELDNVAINDVLPLKAARNDAIANL